MRSLGKTATLVFYAIVIAACSSENKGPECRVPSDCPKDGLYFCLEGACVPLFDNDAPADDGDDALELPDGSDESGESAVSDDTIDEGEVVPEYTISDIAAVLEREPILPDLISGVDATPTDEDVAPDEPVVADDAVVADDDIATDDGAIIPGDAAVVEADMSGPEDALFPDDTVLFTDDGPGDDADALLTETEWPDEDEELPDDDGPCTDGIRCTLDIAVDGGGCLHLPRHYLCDAGELCSPVDGCRPAADWFCNACPQGQKDCTYPDDICAPLLGTMVCLIPCYLDGQCPGGFACKDIYDNNDTFIGRGCLPDNYVCCINYDGDNAGIGAMCGLQDCDEGNPFIYPGATEICNDRDDNCDGNVDEGNPNGGLACMSELPGICRQGISTCVGGAIDCVPIESPEEELCNSIDDDCDGGIDEDFKNPLTGRYEGDTACGNCLTDCTVIYDRPQAYGICDASGEPTCLMRCERIAAGDAGDAFDLNLVPQDGCELILDADAIYVSVQDGDDLDPACGLAPLGTLEGAIPCASISRGLERAQGTGRSKVLVADGLYEETVRLHGGVELAGGYRADTWERHLDSTMTILRGADTDPTHAPHRMAVVAAGITEETRVEGFIIYGQNNPDPGGNSYGIHFSGSQGMLAIYRVTLYAGNGGPGADATAGVSGANGLAGSGRPADGVGYDTFSGNGRPCTDLDRIYQNGGKLTCGGTTVDGGDGGGTRCAPVGYSEYSAIDGSAGQGVSGGPGGDAGNDGAIETAGICTLPGAPMSGGDGSNGGNGFNGVAGSGCSDIAGGVTGLHWKGPVADNGQNGTHGGGGGGGGAGGGGDSNIEETNDRIGGVGGGGGSGACGGGQGHGGAAGGGSFGIFVVDSLAPAIGQTTIIMGLGGDGGNGGAGGAGGVGGSGGPGGLCLDNCWCYQRGGKGGEGGDGGHGGGGGGGCGGVSFGIYLYQAGGMTDYQDVSLGNGFSGGSAGQGGKGGLSLGVSGSDGQSGHQAPVLYAP